MSTMTTLTDMHTTLEAIGKDHVAITDKGIRATTSGYISRWWNRVCAFFCSSSQNKNQDVCNAFLGIIRRTPGMGGTWACLAENILYSKGGRYKSGRPLSGRKALKVLTKTIRIMRILYHWHIDPKRTIVSLPLPKPIAPRTNPARNTRSTQEVLGYIREKQNIFGAEVAPLLHELFAQYLPVGGHLTNHIREVVETEFAMRYSLNAAKKKDFASRWIECEQAIRQPVLEKVAPLSPDDNSMERVMGSLGGETMPRAPLTPLTENDIRDPTTGLIRINPTDITQQPGSMTCFIVSMVRGLVESADGHQHLSSLFNFEADGVHIALQTPSGEVRNMVVTSEDLAIYRILGGGDRRPAALVALELAVVRLMPEYDRTYEYGVLGHAEHVGCMLGLHFSSITDEVFKNEQAMTTLIASLTVGSNQGTFITMCHQSHYQSILGLVDGKESTVRIGDSLGASNRYVTVQTLANNIIMSNSGASLDAYSVPRL